MKSSCTKGWQRPTGTQRAPENSLLKGSWSLLHNSKRPKVKRLETIHSMQLSSWSSASLGVVLQLLVVHFSAVSLHVFQVTFPASFLCVCVCMCVGDLFSSFNSVPSDPFQLVCQQWSIQHSLSLSYLFHLSWKQNTICILTCIHISNLLCSSWISCILFNKAQGLSIKEKEKKSLL